MEITDYVRIFDDQIKKENIDSFLKVKDSFLKFQSAGVGDHNTINEKIRKVQKHQITYFPKLSKTELHWNNFFTVHIVSSMRRFCSSFPQQCSLQINKIQSIEYLKYEDDGGHYDYHVDDFPGVYTRVLSAIIYLNDDFIGGELLITDPFQKKTIKIVPQKGRIVVFPSNFLFLHKVEPVKQGVRYAIVGWGC